MARYFFNLKDGARVVRDLEGAPFPSFESARAHAETVAREILRNGAPRTRYWRVQICDESHTPCDEIVLAAVDERLDHLPPEYKDNIAAVAKGFGRLTDSISELRITLTRVR